MAHFYHVQLEKTNGLTISQPLTLHLQVCKPQDLALMVKSKSKTKYSRNCSMMSKRNEPLLILVPCVTSLTMDVNYNLDQVLT